MHSYQTNLTFTLAYCGKKKQCVHRGNKSSGVIINQGNNSFNGIILDLASSMISHQKYDFRSRACEHAQPNETYNLQTVVGFMSQAGRKSFFTDIPVTPSLTSKVGDWLISVKRRQYSNCLAITTSPVYYFTIRGGDINSSLMKIHFFRYGI